jgi:hypothetical protein
MEPLLTPDDANADVPSSASLRRNLLRRNLLLLNCYCFLLGLTFLSPLYVPHVRTSLGERATWTSVVLASQAASCCLVELPAGVMADLCGRKHCLFACSLVRLLGLAVLAALQTYMSELEPVARLACFVLVSALEGVAQALASGADVALLHDSLTAMGDVHDFPARLATRSIMWPAAAALANLVGAPIAETFGMQACVAATAVATVLALPVAASLYEAYPREYCPSRMWRRFRRRQPLLQQGARHHHQYIHLPAAALGPPVTIGETLLAPGSPAAAPNGLRSRKPHAVTVAQSVTVTNSPIVAAEAQQPSTPVRQSRHGSRSRSRSRSRARSGNSSPVMEEVLPLCLTPSGSPMPCSPFAGMPLPSVPGFLSLLQSHLSACTATLRSAPALPWLIAWGALYHGASEPVHRVRSVLLLAHGLPAAQLGVVGAAGFGLSALGSLLSTRISLTARRIGLGDGGVILLCSVLPPLMQWFACSFSTSGDSVAGALLCGSLLWGARAPLVAHLLHKALTASGQRATVSSLQSLANKMMLVRHAGQITQAQLWN